MMLFYDMIDSVIVNIKQQEIIKLTQKALCLVLLVPNYKLAPSGTFLIGNSNNL